MSIAIAPTPPKNRCWNFEKLHKFKFTRGTSWSFCVNCDVCRDDKTQSSIPRAGFDPRHCVEQGIGAAVASVHVSDTFDIIISCGTEDSHQDCFQRFRFVQQRFGSDFELADVSGVDFVLFEEVGNDYGNGSEFDRQEKIGFCYLSAPMK